MLDFDAHVTLFVNIYPRDIVCIFVLGHGTVVNGIRMRIIFLNTVYLSRQMYKEYEGLYHRYLLEGHSGELETDLMRLEDSLSLTNIVLARVSAKLKVCPSTHMNVFSCFIFISF